MSDETPKNPPRPVPPPQPVPASMPTQPVPFSGPPPTQAAGGAPPPGPGTPWGAALTPEPQAPSPRRRPTVLIVGVVALVAVVMLGFVLVLRNGNSGDAGERSTSVPEPALTVADEPDPTVDPTTEPTTTTSTITATELSRSVVQILATFPDGACTGSGTIIDASGLILTNSHVIARSEVCPWDELLIATVDTPDLPPQVLFDAVVVADDPVLDLAAVRISARRDGEPVVPNFPAVEIGDSDALELGEGLSILGFPGIGGETITFTEGTISGFIEQPGLGVRSWVKTDASIAGGNSGGLAADRDGRIVGVPSRAGTGDAEDITDCRLVADTNSDGRIDDADSCIPIGGFINGIRPINAAASIIAQGLATPVPTAPATTVPATTVPATTVPPTTAPPTTAPPTTAPPTTGPAPAAPFAANPRFSLQTTNGLPDPEAFIVPDGATQLCLTWEYANFPAGAPFELGWTIDGVFDGGSFAQGTNQGAESGEFFGCIANEGGLAPGRYEAGWAVSGRPVFNHSIYVGGGRAPLTIGLQNDTPDAICAISWTPVGASGRGLAQNTSAINPGARFETVLASGRYATAVADCAGNIIFSDPDTEFATDLTLTLPI